MNGLQLSQVFYIFGYHTVKMLSMRFHACVKCYTVFSHNAVSREECYPMRTV